MNFSISALASNLGMQRRKPKSALKFQSLDGAPCCFFDSKHSLDKGSAILRSEKSGELYHLCVSCHKALEALLSRESIRYTMLERCAPEPKEEVKAVVNGMKEALHTGDTSNINNNNNGNGSGNGKSVNVPPTVPLKNLKKGTVDNVRLIKR